MPANNGQFGGDPCVNTVKILAVNMTGNCGAPVGPRKYLLATVVPVGASAQVIVPIFQSPTSATILESGNAVWQGGAFVPGVAGVSAGVAGNDTSSVVFSVVSGSYSFAVY